jgi:enoyl-CoA hydratase/carnithine racemase
MLDAQRHDAILELRLARPPVNALDPTLVRMLKDTILEAPATGARAIVLSGSPGVFSAGLDVPALLALERAAMQDFWRDFIGLLGAIGRCPVPVVAALTGHSPAGGAVLSIFCDYRVMARSTDAAKPFRIGLNEVQVGLSVPPSIQFALRRLLGTHRAERLMVAGAMVDAETALRIGLVDELAEVASVVPQAMAWCRQHLALPPEAMAETRRIARADLHEMLGRAMAEPAEDFMARWFSAESQGVLQALVAKLKTRG